MDSSAYKKVKITEVAKYFFTSSTNRFQHISAYLLKAKRGFTIIELIVVISTMAVLAAIIVVSVSKYIEKAQNSAIVANIDAARKAGIIYFNDHQTYDGFFNDVSYINPKNAILKVYPDSNPTERIDISSTAYCVCYGLKGESGSNKHTICIDSSSYAKEMNYQRNCGWRCQSDGTCRD